MRLDRVAVSTQTPLLRQPAPGIIMDNAGRASVPRLADLHITPGGVSRMVLQTVEAWRQSGQVSGDVHWFSLQPDGLERLRLDEVGLELHHLRMPPDALKAYARTKEKLWADIHGLPSQPFDRDDFRSFARYNALTSDAILEEAPDLDAVYVHDFQLLQVGSLVGLAAPCVLRWHVPFVPSRMPSYTRNFVLRSMEAFDAVIVSTRRDLEGLVNAGYRGFVRQVYPHSDPDDHTRATRANDQELADIVGIPPAAPVVLCVARMDPMKRQDLVIEAFAKVHARHPDALLVFVGNGSFSGAKHAGLGLSKSGRWRSHLETVAQDLGILPAIRFTGWMPDPLVAAAYARADVVVLASDLEGFGLTPFEAWGHRKPCIVTEGCGAAEVVQSGLTGFTVPSGDVHELASRIDAILTDETLGPAMGRAGSIALRAFTPALAAKQEASVLERARRRFERSIR
jgi:glycosyltransferase involved in cell wall biosynthesis